jgi:bHLH factor
MQEMNDAFAELEKLVPDQSSEQGKQTKITTLRLAMNYISALREMLGFGEPVEATKGRCKTSMNADQLDVSDGISLSDEMSTSDGISESDGMTVSDKMSVSVSSPGQRSLLDSEGEFCYPS